MLAANLHGTRMYNDLEQIANLKFGKEMESISKETHERVRELQNEYAALTGSSGVRSGPQEASIGRAKIEGAERLVRAFYQVWVDLVKRRRGHISREDVGFIADKVDTFARAQKVHLQGAISQQRMGLPSVLQEAETRMHAVAANARRELEILVREHEAFSSDSSMHTKQPQNRDLDNGSKPTRHTADVLNILIASPSDVNEERQVIEKVIHDWNATHFSSIGIMLNPIKWESHAYPASGDRPQAIINKQIVESGDILVAIFGCKLGTPTGAALSGTIEEIEEFRKAGKYVALYFSTANVPRHADHTQLEALESYKTKRQKDALYFEFEDSSSLRDHFTRHLPKIVYDVYENSNPPSLSQGPNTDSPTLLAEIVSELEDNLDCASGPRAGDVYRRPSTGAWIGNRNRITLPPDVYQRLKDAYRSILSWADIVASGRHPNLGSQELDRIVSGLRSSLPPLIDQLRMVQEPRPQ